MKALGQLFNKTKNQLVVAHVEEANTHFERMRGLLGRASYPETSGMLFFTTSIHTFFMNFPIDVVFLDRNLRVVRATQNVKPGRIIWPVLIAKSVIEFSVGAIERGKIEVGDQLHVGH